MRSSIGSSKREILRSRSFLEVRAEKLMAVYVKYTSKKMWHVANLVRGLSVDEALKQLDFINKKGAFIAAEVIREAQEMAVKDHCVEYRSNLWVAESFATKGMVMKGVRRHARMRMSMVKSTLHSSQSKTKCTLIYSLFSV